MTPPTYSNRSDNIQSLRFGRTTVSVVAGDVFSTDAEAIVVPANRRGMMVAGVAGHVRLRGGIDVEREIMQQAPLTLGTSVATTSGELAANGVRLILHAVLFDDLGGTTRLDIVERALDNVLQSADRHRVRSLIIPPIGTGVGQGRLTPESVYRVIVDEVSAHLRRYTSRIDHVVIACPDRKDTRFVFGLVQESHSLWWKLKAPT